MAAAFINRLLPGSDTTEGLDRLFAGPSSTATVDPAFAASTSGQGNASVQTNSLDEPISVTIMRDLRRIYSNLVMVIVPFEFARYVDVEDEDVDDLASPGSRQTARRNQALKNWDLWGPMLFTIGLAIPLSIGTSKPSSTFSLVFGLISVGAIVLTVNVVLLGGSIGFLQSISLLGYCLAPLNVRYRRFSTVSSIDARPSPHSSLLLVCCSSGGRRPVFVRAESCGAMDCDADGSGVGELGVGAVHRRSGGEGQEGAGGVSSGVAV